MNLKSYLDRSLTYDQYVDILEKNLALHNRHYKNFQLDKIEAEKINSLMGIQILVITEPWCGDSLALLPLVKKLSESNPKWTLNVVLRDQNPDLIDKFLTNGGRAIPIFLFLDYEGNYLFHWGPRPLKAQNIFEQHREQLNEGKIEKSEVILKIRKFYAKDKGVESSKELLDIIYTLLK